MNEYIRTHIFKDMVYLNDDDLMEFDINNFGGWVEKYGEDYNLTIKYTSDEEFKFITLKLPNKIIKDYIKGTGILKSWLLNRINKKMSLTKINYTSLFKELGLNSGMVYYTSYGFGYYLIGDLYVGDRFKKEIGTIKKFLDDRSIKYLCETSEGGWVYRFKISQSKENLKIIKGCLK